MGDYKVKCDVVYHFDDVAKLAMSSKENKGMLRVSATSQRITGLLTLFMVQGSM